MMSNILSFSDKSTKHYQQTANVFLPHHRETVVKLKRGERLFILSDDGLDESPHVGPDEVMVITERFKGWPVVGFAIPAQDVEAWRAIDPSSSAPKMMARIRRRLDGLNERAASADYAENGDDNDAG